ncbi:MAG TPA: hypothetical protein PKK10_16485 [Woeseiaceae bacterium]|nr:hypothetical protein [Woeseiaceae bacterium]
MTTYVDRFFAAVSVLAGDGYIKQRLIRAYADNLADIDEDELPVAVKEEFADTRKCMHSVAPMNGESPISASVRKMSAREASACALALFSIYSELLKQDEGTQRRPVKKKSTAAPFIVKSISR